MTFRKDEWALSFMGGRDSQVSLVRVAEEVYHSATECLVYMGSFTTKHSVSTLHKLPSSMKKLIPKDLPGKRLTTFM